MQIQRGNPIAPVERPRARTGFRFRAAHLFVRSQPMNRKRIVVMGFMAGCPIAGVVWQHIHYIVGLQRLGHEVVFIEGSGPPPYDAAEIGITDDYSYTLARLPEN